MFSADLGLLNKKFYESVSTQGSQVFYVDQEILPPEAHVEAALCSDGPDVSSGWSMLL